VLGTLRRVGTRTTYCGDPGSALQITDVLWETAAGGRVFVVYHGGAARKYLFDLNRDSIIEQEMWDPDSDGKFEAVRPAHMPIPEFLMPARAPRTALATVTDTISSDSLGAPSAAGVSGAPSAAIEYSPELFSSTGAGPLRFWNAQQRARGQQVQPDSQAQQQSAPAPVRRDTVPRDTVRRDTSRAAAASTNPAPPSINYSPQLFSSTGAGPLRFWNELQRSRAPKVQPPAPVQQQPPAAVRRDTLPRDTVRRDTLR
jgi:hypothetical protein